MTEKRKRLILWILIVATTPGLAFLGLFKLIHHPIALERAHSLHYGTTFMTLIGVCEILGAAALFLRRVRALACIGLSLTVTGAVGVHVGAQDALENVLPGLGYLIAFGLILAFDDSFRIEFSPKGPVASDQLRS